MEALGWLSSRAVQGGLLQGFDVGVDPAISKASHLFYANDVLIFFGADVAQIGHLRCVLLCFEAISSLRVNLAKSELIPVGEVLWTPMLVAILGCKVASLPVSYLGLPLGASFKAKRVWDEVVDQVQRWLSGWKQQYLFKGGRLTLIKSVQHPDLLYVCSCDPSVNGEAD